MSKSLHTGRFVVAGGATTDIVVTGLGFTPTSIAVMAGSTSLATVKVFGTSHGAASDVGAEGCIAGIGSRYGNMVASGVCIPQAYNDRLFQLSDDTLAEEVFGNLKSFDTDGFTVSVPTNTLVDDALVLYSAYKSA